MFGNRFDWLFRSNRTEQDIVEAPEESEDSNDEDGTIRPPGWEPLYGSFEKPVYPIDDNLVSDALNSLASGGEWASVHRTLPKMGTNKDQFVLSLYTVQRDDSRLLIGDLEIHEFSEWVPEEKGEYSYPEESLSMNGPYYLQLSKELTNELAFHPHAFELDEYDAETDIAFFSGEKEVRKLS